MPPKHTRKPKSHRGCTTCRATKRKCSEDKPICKNCLRDGKVCEYDIDVLFRIQTYDGTQLPNRRMRQIITPLHKVIDRQKSSIPQSAARSSSPQGVDLSMESPIPPGHSLPMVPLLRQRDSLPPTEMETRQIPRPLLTSARRIETLANDAPTLSSPEIDPSIFTDFSSSSSDSLSSSPKSLYGYGSSMMDVIDSNQTNVTPPMIVMTADESLLFGFFLREVPSLLPFSELFPSVCNDLWAMAVTHIPLTQSILAISSDLSDRRADVPRIHRQTYLKKALTRLQEAISAGIVDEGVIIAVFLLALLNTLSGEFKNSRRHLQGMCRLLQFYHQQRAGRIPPNTIPYNSLCYPIVMLVWRMAIRMEYHVAFYDGGQGAPIFPINESHESQHIEWISQIIDKTIPNGVDWALASFALDDLMNRAGHLSHKISERCIDSIDRAFQTQQLVEEHQSWKGRPVVNQAIIERLSSLPDSTINPNLIHASSRTTFLHYLPTGIQNNLYASLLIRHFMTGIHLSLISVPCPGSVSPKQLQSAIDICRYFVALYGDPPYPNGDPLLRPVDNCMDFITAGFTFQEENYTQGFDYCVRTLSAIAKETGFPALFDVLEILKATNRDTSCGADSATGYLGDCSITRNQMGCI